MSAAAAVPAPAQLRADPPASAPMRPASPPREAVGANGPLLFRLAACTALALFGAHAWAGMVQPAAGGPLLLAALCGAALGLVVLLLGAGTLRRAPRGLALAGVGLLAIVAALLCAGVPASLLGPKVWDDLAGGLGNGVSALPSLSVPYRGVDEWNRIAMLLGGTALAVAGPLLACWPGRDGRPAGPGVPAVILTVLYAVPAVQLSADHPILDGTVFALLLMAVLLGERLAPRDIRVAVPAVAAALLVGALFAPRLDATDPWLDYESIAQSLGERGTTSFSWDHQYGPLTWPRDGREVLRIRARESAYWKATTLADFDGLRWRDVRPQGSIEDDPAAESPNPAWVQSLRVTVRNLRTDQFITAGTTLRVERSPRTVVPGAPGSFVTGGDRPLRRGHAYLARVYTPKPRSAQLDAAGTDYPDVLWPYLSMQLPQSVGGPAAPDADARPNLAGRSGFVVFSTWGSASPALGYYGRGYGERTGERWVQQSRYARTYRLAGRLRAQATSPYEYVRRVQSYLQNGFTYSETPPVRPIPLEAFLFDDKVGYCQQFSGAMALLLRMGGVPARVATGFTPGTLDTTRKEYVVRDLDAHSWVEAYFPGYGWVTFDPTPAIAPPRSQAAGIDQQDTASAADQESRTGNAAGDRASDAAGIDNGAAAKDAPSTPIARYVAFGLGGAIVLGVAALAVRRRRRRATMTAADHVRELERALRRSGRTPVAGLTLSGLERRLGGTSDAAGYVRALRDGRYGFGAGLPSRAQRSALRRELRAGLGLRGRIRALWALPPW
jgi:transglutaminase-like putative cysteine protease